MYSFLPFCNHKFLSRAFLAPFVGYFECKPHTQHFPEKLNKLLYSFTEIYSFHPARSFAICCAGCIHCQGVCNAITKHIYCTTLDFFSLVCHFSGCLSFAARAFSVKSRHIYLKCTLIEIWILAERTHNDFRVKNFLN